MDAADRKEPKKAYLEFELQPINNIPYTPKEDKANINKIAKEKSRIAKPGYKGTTIQFNKLKIKVEIGAI